MSTDFYHISKVQKGLNVLFRYNRGCGAHRRSYERAHRPGRASSTKTPIKAVKTVIFIR
jgi:hypothetical protein